MSDAEKEIRFPDGRIEHPDARYEAKDVRFGCIVAILIAAVCFIVVHFTVVWFFFGAEQRIQAGSKQSPYPLAPAPSAELPPEPRLEQIDHMQNKLSGTVDQRQAAYEPPAEKGFVHIPIEDAMKKIVDQLPVREQPPDHGKDRGLLDDGLSNSGRMFRGGEP
jgi:hypothetical protein